MTIVIWKPPAGDIGQSVYSGVRPVSAQWLKRYHKRQRDEIAREFRNARKTPDGRKLARLWWNAIRVTRAYNEGPEL